MPSYGCPPANASTTERLAWLRMAITEGHQFLQNQPGFANIQTNLERIARWFPSALPQSLKDNANLQYNKTRAQIDEAVATLSNMRPLWHTVANDRAFDESVKVLNKSVWNWWYSVGANKSLNEVLQFSAICRTGYLLLDWNPHYYGKGQGEIGLTALGPTEVLPIGLTASGKIQDAYAVIIREEMPITEAYRRYPTCRDQLIPTSGANNSWWQRAMNTIGVVGVEALFRGHLFSKNMETPAVGVCPTVTIYRAYINDDSRNLTGRTVRMGNWTEEGVPVTNWSYEVPSVGGLTPSGKVDELGRDLMRTPTDTETYLYPGRRLIIFTDHALLHDGTSFYFHGKVPVVKFTLQPWVCNWLGGCMVDEVFSTNENLRDSKETALQNMKLRQRPPMKRNARMMSQRSSNGAPWNKAGEIYEVNEQFGTGKAFEPLLDAQYYDLPHNVESFWQGLEKDSEDALGLLDYRALARARQVPSGDTQLQLLMSMSARIHAKSLNIDLSMAEVAEQVNGLMLQFYDAPRRFKLFGQDGLTDADYDFDPATLVPGTLPNTHAASSVNAYRWMRGQAFQRTLSVQIQPGSLHDLLSMTERLIYLQLHGRGFPLDSQTLAEKLRIPNFGNELAQGLKNDTVFARYMKEQELRATEMTRVQIQQQLLQLMAQMQTAPIIQQMQQEVALSQNPAAAQIVQMLKEQGGGGGAPTGMEQPEGRPPTWNDTPSMEMRTDEKTGGQRPVISTSGD